MMEIPSIGFDFDSIYEAEEGPKVEPFPGVLGSMQPEQRDSLLFAFRAVFRWVLTVPTYHKQPADLIGRRMLALAWAITPGMIDGSPSLCALAERLGVSKQNLSLLSAEASRRFGLRNSPQRHGWNFKRKKRLKNATRI